MSGSIHAQPDSDLQSHRIMPKRSPTSLVVFCVALCATALRCDLHAQDVTLRGKLVDPNGAPVGKAEITLISRVLPRTESVGDLLTLKAETNDRGLFQCRVPVSRAFSVWATHKLAANRTRFSQIENDVDPGQPLLLTLAKQARRECEIQISGLEAWKHVGPLTVHAYLDSSHRFSHPLIVDKQGTLTLPSVPGNRVSILVRDANGEPLHGWDLPLPSGQEADRSEAVEKVSFDLPPPLRVSVRVQSKLNKKPLAGAQIHCHIVAFRHPESRRRISRSFDEVYRHAGKTNADGEAILEVPWIWNQSSARRHPILATMPGYMTATARLLSGPQSDCELIKRDEGPPKLVFNLSNGFSLTGQVLDREGKPLTGLALSCGRNALAYRKGGNASWSHLTPHQFLTDGSGRFRIEGALPHLALTLVALPTRAQMQRMIPELPQGMRTTPISNRVYLWGKRRFKPSDKPISTGALGGPDLQMVSVSFREADGDAISGGIVSLCDTSLDDYAGMQRFEYSNRKGRLLFVLRPGKYRLFATDFRRYYALEQIEISKKHDAMHEVALVAKRILHIQGRVQDAVGEPVAGARIRRRTGRNATSVPRQVSKINDKLIRNFTNKKGEFRALFIPWDGYSFSICATVILGGNHEHSSESAFADQNSIEDAVLSLRVMKGP